MVPDHLRSAFRDYRPLLAFSLVYALAVSSVAPFYGFSLAELFKVVYGMGFSFLLAGAFLMFLYFFSFAREIYRGGIRGAVKRNDAVCAGYIEGRVFAWGCMGLLACLSVNFFLIVKCLVPVIHPYKLDPLFAEIDRVVHFGQYPHVGLFAVFDPLKLGNAIDICYAAWFLVMYGFLAYSLFIDADIERRLRFQWCYILSWVLLGSVAAVALSSVGPLFFAEFYPEIPDPYADLMAHHEMLAQGPFPFIAEVTRGMLVEWTRNDRLMDPNSISAMPSMHVAMVWLFVLYARHINKAAFIGAALFFISIAVSCVYLGFHYAIDAYVSIIAVSLIWRMTGRFKSIRRAGKKA